MVFISNEPRDGTRVPARNVKKPAEPGPPVRPCGPPELRLAQFNLPKPSNAPPTTLGRAPMVVSNLGLAYGTQSMVQTLALTSRRKLGLAFRNFFDCSPK